MYSFLPELWEQATEKPSATTHTNAAGQRVFEGGIFTAITTTIAGEKPRQSEDRISGTSDHLVVLDKLSNTGA